MDDVLEVVRRAEERGIDVVDVLLRELDKLDPGEALSLRLSLAERYLKEAEEYVNRNDAVQASEKAYKAAEELVKALAEKFNLPEYQEAMKEGRWYTYLLARASGRLAEKLGHWVVNGWDAAYALHVWGFHEGRLKVDDVVIRMRFIREMLEKARDTLAAGG